MIAPTVVLTNKAHSPTSGTVSFTCNVTGNPDPVVTWKYNKADITLQSRLVSNADGTVNGLTTSQLVVKVPNIDGVLFEYKCKRTDPSTRDVECTSPFYVCKARYRGGSSSVQTTTVITNLGKFNNKLMPWRDLPRSQFLRPCIGLRTVCSIIFASKESTGIGMIVMEKL